MRTSDNPPRSARSEQKRQQVLRAAEELFLADGYANTSMDAVTAKAGVSKATVYAYFSSKEELFATLLREGTEDIFSRLPVLDHEDQDPAQELQTFLEPLVQVILSPRGRGWDRLVVAEAERYPENALSFYRATVERVLKILTRYFDQLVQVGLLQTKDTKRIAEELLALAIVYPGHMALLGIHAKRTSQEHKRRLVDSIQTCLQAHGTKKEK